MRYSLPLAGFLISCFFHSPLRAQQAAPPVPYGGVAAPETAPKPDGAPKVDGAHRRENRRDAVEARLRSLMKNFGLEDKAKQDALVAYLAEDEAGKVAVRDAARRLMIAVRRGAEPERMRELLGLYKAALEADKTRRVAAQAGLDAQIGYSREPRLEAVLWLFGVLGDAQPGLASAWMGQRSSRSDGSPQRRGVVEGTVTGRGENWVEVSENGARAERYELPKTENSPAPAPGGEAVTLAPGAVKIGDRVRIEWVGNERRRIVKLTALGGERKAKPLHKSENH